MIKILSREAIEDKKWNGCVHFAINSLPYGYTWWLDNTTEEWEGLVMGDYEVVMPLPFKKKAGIYYIYQPEISQQLGIFSLKPLGKKLITEFLQAIPDKYRLIDFQVNYMNYTILDGFEFRERINLELDLNQHYEDIYKSYSSNQKRNIKKAEKAGLKMTTNLKPEAVVSFFKEHSGDHITAKRQHVYHTLHRLIYKSMHYGMSQTYGVNTPDGDLVGTAFFLFTPTRIINLLPSSNATGKQLGAAAFLMDFLIKINAGSLKIFDFEGSSIPSIARFYSGFGAKEVKYWRLYRNKLPWYLKLFKQ